MKRCSKCEVAKDENEFFFHPDTRSKLRSECKSCVSTTKRELRRLKKQNLILSFGGKCSRCGYDKCFAALEFHHTGDDKSFELNYLQRSYKKLLVEASKCALFCANCHRELHHCFGSV